MIGSITLSMTYGVDILPENDPNMQLAHEGGKAVGEALVAGSKIVDVMPLLKYLPVWFPGASFQKAAARSRVQAEKLREGIFAQAHKKWVSLHYTEVNRCSYFEEVISCIPKSVFCVSLP